MTVSRDLEPLHQRWLELDGAADAESLRYFRLAIEPKAVVPAREWKWLTRASALHQFVLDKGRLPARAPAVALQQAPEEVLVNWLRYQRRRVGTLCTYQKERLEIVPLFTWSPRDDGWDGMFDSYLLFVASAGRPPRISSDSIGERSLALWSRRQRSSQRRGALARHRVQELDEMTGWAWSPCVL